MNWPIAIFVSPKTEFEITLSAAGSGIAVAELVTKPADFIISYKAKPSLLPWDDQISYLCPLVVK